MWCRVVRRIIEWRSDSDKPPGKFARRHLSGCASCREHFQAQEVLADRLRRTAAEGASPSPGLKDRILSAVPSARRPSQRTIRLYPAIWRIGVAAALAACVVVGIVFLVLRNPPRESAPPDGKTPTVALPEIGPILTPQAAERSTRAVRELAQAVLMKEIDDLAQDAKDAGEALLACVTVDFGKSR